MYIRHPWMFFLEEDIICLEAQFWGVGLHLFAREIAARHCTPTHHSSCVKITSTTSTMAYFEIEKLKYL